MFKVDAGGRYYCTECCDHLAEIERLRAALQALLDWRHEAEVKDAQQMARIHGYKITDEQAKRLHAAWKTAEALTSVESHKDG